MKVWITKYALTDGIIETEIVSQDPVWTVFKNNMSIYSKNIGIDFHTSLNGAKLQSRRNAPKEN